MTRHGAALLLIACAGLACGKYGPPVRSVPDPQPQDDPFVVEEEEREKNP